MSDFDKLQEHVDKLGVLLKERETGRVTWHMFVGGHWKAIVDMWDSPNRKNGQKSITPKRAKELETAAVVYAVGFPNHQIEITKGVLTYVEPDYLDKKRTTALLAVNATVTEALENRKNFDTLMITNWNHIFEHEESAKAYAVGILKKRIDVINEEIEKYS